MAAMGGRFLLRARAATALPVLVLAIALVLIPSVGSRVVPAAALATGSPAATVVHLLGDEAVPAPPVLEVRSRLLVPDAASLAALLVALTGLLGLVAAFHRSGPDTVSPARAPVHRAPGRSPPRSSSHR
jgi:hypothetical protein